MIARVVTMFTIPAVLGAIVAGQFIATEATAQSRPNIVVIVVDDLDSGSVAHMPAVQRHLARDGATLTRFFASTPLCCPSRVSLLRGQYAHNHGVLRNTGEDAGFTAFHESGFEGETLATILDDAGYETALVGKYLNGYSMNGEARTFIPPGWDFWVAGVDHAAYGSFNYDLNINGEIVRHGREDRDYLTDVLSGHAQTFLNHATSADQPFMLYLAPYAVHSPATPAPRHKGIFRGATAPRTSAFNERNVRDKPTWVRTTGRLSDAKIERIDHDYQRRLESLQAVDEMVDAVVKQLDASGMVESTYLLFLSDNGYFLGEHRQPHGKDAPYDAASRVPMIVRGPGVSADSSIGQLALNIDVAPTIIDMAGLATPSWMDGRSLAPILKGDEKPWRKSVLLEGFGKETEFLEGAETSTPPFRALRTADELYVEYETGERELYNLRKDPLQIANHAETAPNALLRGYSRHLDELASCSGRECRQIEDEPLSRRPDGDRHGAENRRHDAGSEQRHRPRVQESRFSERTSGAQPLRVGGEDDAHAVVRLEMSPREAKTDALHLRIHVAAVESPGTLLATLESTATADGAADRRSERLDRTRVRESGWLTLDISDALGDSRQLAIGLRGRDGALLMVSSSGSTNPPSLVVLGSKERAGPNEARQDRRHGAERRSDDRGRRARHSS